MEKHTTTEADQDLLRFFVTRRWPKILGGYLPCLSLNDGSRTDNADFFCINATLPNTRIIYISLAFALFLAPFLLSRFEIGNQASIPMTSPQAFDLAFLLFLINAFFLGRTRGFGWASSFLDSNRIQDERF